MEVQASVMTAFTMLFMLSSTTKMYTFSLKKVTNIKFPFLSIIISTDGHMRSCGHTSFEGVSPCNCTFFPGPLGGDWPVVFAALSVTELFSCETIANQTGPELGAYHE